MWQALQEYMMFHENGSKVRPWRGDSRRCERRRSWGEVACSHGRSADGGGLDGGAGFHWFGEDLIGEFGSCSLGGIFCWGLVLR